MRNIGVILAGGVGERVGLDIPKQLIKIAGRPIIEHTLAVFQESDCIDEIVVMMKPGYLDRVHEIIKKNAFSKVTRVLEGSGTRNDTTQAALAALGDEECNVILHDAVRPLLAQRVLSDVVVALDEYAAVDVAIPSADTIIEVVQGAGSLPEISHVPPRAALRRGQTPQAFRLSTLREAYVGANQDSAFAATDDCSVVLKYSPNVPIGVVQGEERNMKVTDPIDIYIADKLFQLYNDDGRRILEDTTLTEALSGKVMVVFGGAYGIGHDIAATAEKHGCVVRSFSRSSTKTHVDRRDDVVAARDAVLAELGRVDFVVNTAGVLPRGLLCNESDESIYQATEINYLGPVFIAQAFHDALAASQGSLLLFTSSSYTRGRAGYSLYSSAKAATVNLTQALADEWAEDRIRVNCVNPERTGTPMRTKAFGAEDPNSLLASTTVARASLETLVGSRTGHVIDVRRDDPLSPASLLNQEDI
ncbi:bifunctional cytidylyltransferase/SDR family oxidoreductase [Paeniglutamicibacter sp. Y32M11]|uniref:bifunctional cytidylyltransferase/SDR family oxidoreductase n=1 Tax=Paeniglutamicibacter sp. Y32M11 TaxID=2853258 RepID=UPI001C52ADA5|nr:bifunctional cytidylyltransferase/SDR family oxidoreductase [Paeniglutamicibacter sp. Y32M11]QXQ08939.1 bifunctional cytidylyltransferase/SDR family oxidoreductase [Paeniglutamicibacter sp. Y32M11]